MRVLILIKSEIIKLKRYSIKWIGVAAAFISVLVSYFMTNASDGEVYNYLNFSDLVIWNSTTMFFPATITLVALFMINREFSDEVIKNILVIPLQIKNILISKLIVLFFIALLYGLLISFFTTVISFMLGYAQLTLLNFALYTMKFCLVNGTIFFAVLPVIVIFAYNKSSYLVAVVLAFFYGFLSVIFAGHNLINVHPITISLVFINYQASEYQYNILMALGTLILTILVASLILKLRFDKKYQFKV